MVQLSESGQIQRSVLEQMNIEALPRPFCDNIEYYDGNVYFTLNIAGESDLKREQLIRVAATNGLNDWWIDESGKFEGHPRDFTKAEQFWTSVNDFLYDQIEGVETDLNTIPDEEIRRAVRFYEAAISDLPDTHRRTIISNLLMINLYQGVTLFQDNNFRAQRAIPDLSTKDLEELKEIQTEKGGMMALYFAFNTPEYFDLSQTLPPREQVQTLDDLYRYFRDNDYKLYPREGVVRYAVRLGGVIQIIDDIEDVDKDFIQGVISPENLSGELYTPSQLSTLIINRTDIRLVELATEAEGEIQEEMHDKTTIIAKGIAKYRSKRILNS